MSIYPTPKPAVKTAISILADAFGHYALVSAKMPKQRPIRFVKVSRIGGGWSNKVTDTARLLIECYGPDTETAEAMTGTARAAMLNAISTIVDGVWIRNWDNENGPTDFWNPAIIDMERWQFQGDLSLSTTTAS